MDAWMQASNQESDHGVNKQAREDAREQGRQQTNKIATQRKCDGIIIHRQRQENKE